MHRPPLASRPVLALLVALAALAPLAPANAGPAPLLAYNRDAADFLKHRHATLMRRPGNAVGRKFAKMSDSPIGFFRGGAPLYYRDVAEHPALKSPVTIPLMGDLHLENLGAYRTTGGKFAFDLNDFDEAVDGPYTWELARGAVSVRLHADVARLDRMARGRLVRRFLASYVARLAKLAANPKALAAPITAEQVPGAAAEAIADAAKGDPRTYLAHWAERGRLKPGSSVVPLSPATARGLELSLDPYVMKRREPPGFFKVKDAARRLSGLASLSRMRYLVLVEGPTKADADDLVLDLKEEGPPAASPWLPTPAGSQAERVRKAWDRFVPGSDPYMGTAPGGGADYLVRSMSPYYGEVDVEDLETEHAFGQYVDAVALAVARAHARSGKAAAVLRDAGGAERLAARIAPFAEAYAQQVEADREILQTHVDP